MKVRVQDIAREAGVSPATVSNALNGRGSVGEDTVRRILSIAREMGYSRDKVPMGTRDFIRLVVLKRHGLVVMDTQFFAELTEAMERQCHQCGFELMIAHIHMQKDEDYVERIHSICQEDCAGILLLATEMYAEDVGLFAHARAPLLVLDSLFEHEDLNCVVINNFEAGYKATERLIHRGHRHIAHLTASVRFNNMRFRRNGYEAAMEAHNLPTGQECIWRVTPTLEGAFRDMLDLLKNATEPLPTAFFAANDIIAVGAMRALAEKGIQIPQDISIIGMDDLSVCQISTPPLSTIRVFREDIGRIAVLRLVEMMQKDAPQGIQKTQVGVLLVDRKSILDLHEN